MKYFESRTASGNIQINDSYKNLYLSRKVPISPGRGSGDLQTEEFMVAMGNGTNTISGCVINKPGGYEYYLDKSASQAYLYFFSNHPKIQGNCGLQIFNEKGEIIFDSNAKQAIVLACGGEETSSGSSNLAICCGGCTVQADKTAGAGTEINQSGPYPRTKTVSYNEWEEVPSKQLQPVTKTDPFTEKTTTTWEWVTVYNKQLVTKYKTVTEYYCTYTETVTRWWECIETLYNLALENGIAKSFIYKVIPTGDTKSEVIGLGETTAGATPGEALNNAWFDTLGLASNKKNRSARSIDAYSCVILDASFL